MQAVFLFERKAATLSFMAKIIVAHNFQRLNALLTGLGNKREVQQAVARSIRRTIPAVQRTAFTEIRAKKVLKLKAGEMKLRARAYMEVGAGKSVDRQYGKVWVTPKAENLARFYARRVRAGTSIFGTPLFKVKLNTYGQPYFKSQDRAFLVNRGSGQVLFARVAGAKRLPIVKEKGPGMAELVQQTGIINTMAKVAQTRYQSEFQHNVQYYAQKAIERAMASKR